MNVGPESHKSLHDFVFSVAGCDVKGCESVVMPGAKVGIHLETVDKVFDDLVSACAGSNMKQRSSTGGEGEIIRSVLNEKLDDVQMSLSGGIVEGSVGANGLTMIWIGASFKEETNEIIVAARGGDLKGSLSLSVLHFQKRIERFKRSGRCVAT